MEGVRPPKKYKIKQCDRTTRLVRRVAHPVHPLHSASWCTALVGYLVFRIQPQNQNQQQQQQQRCGHGNNQKYRST